MGRTRNRRLTSQRRNRRIPRFGVLLLACPYVEVLLFACLYIGFLLFLGGSSICGCVLVNPPFRTRQSLLPIIPDLQAHVANALA